MAVSVSIDCFCRKCGEIFTVKKEFPNGLEAEIGAKKIEKQRTLCNECFVSEMQKKNARIAQQLGLPEIVGGSEKQIRFAQSLRERYIQKNEERILYIQAELSKINPAMIPLTAQKHGIPEKTCVPEAFKRIHFEREYICLTENNAKRLIDALR